VGWGGRKVQYEGIGVEACVHAHVEWLRNQLFCNGSKEEDAAKPACEKGNSGMEAEVRCSA